MMIKRYGWKSLTISFVWASLIVALTLLCDHSLSDCLVTPKMHAFVPGAALFVLAVLWFGSGKRLVFDAPALAVTAFIGYLAVRGVAGGESLYRLSFKFAAWFFFMAAHSLTEKERRLLDPAVALAGAVQSAVMILQALRLCGGYMSFGQPGRFENPAGSALCLALALPFCFGMIRNGGSLRREGAENAHSRMSIAGYVCAALTVIGIVLSDSRTGFISVMVCVAAFVMSLKPSFRSRKVIAALSVVAVAAAVLLFFYKKDSASGRVFIWKNTIEAASAKPLLGHGPRAFQKVYMSQQAEFFAEHPDSPYVERSNDVFSPFSEYLHLYCEYGLVGLIILCAALYLILRRRLDFLSLLVLAVFAIFSAFSYPMRYSFGFCILLYVLSGFRGEPLAGARKPLLLNSAFSAAVIALTVPVLMDNSFRRDWNAVKMKYADAHKLFNDPDVRDKSLDPKEIDDYMGLYVRHCHEADFLFDFASVLMQHGRYESSIMILDECFTDVDDYPVHMVYGADYLYLKNYKEAVAHYTEALNMVPCRFLPMYFIMQCHDMAGDKVKAVETALDIIEKPVKVPSREVETAKALARQVVGKYGGSFTGNQ